MVEETPEVIVDEVAETPAETPVETPVDEVVETPTDEVVTEGEVALSTEETPAPEVVEPIAEVIALNAKIAELEAQITELSTQPAAEPIINKDVEVKPLTFSQVMMAANKAKREQLGI